MKTLQKLLWTFLGVLFIISLGRADKPYAYADGITVTIQTSSSSKIYDGTALLLEASATQEGGTFTWYKDGQSVGTGSSYSVLTPTQSGTYTVKYTYQQTDFSSEEKQITVSPKPLTVSWYTQNSPSYPLYRTHGNYVYNGKEQGVFPFLNQVVDADVGNVFVSATNNTQTNAGQYFAHIGELSGTAKDNYVLEKPNETCYYVIDQKSATVTLGDASLQYGKSFNINLPNVSASGLADGETVSILDGAPTCSYNRFDDVGSYEIGYYYNNKNYSLTVEKSTLTVLPYEMDISLQSVSGVYGYALNFPIPTVKGLNNEDLGISIRLDSSIKTYHVGQYDMVPSYTNKNYNLTFSKATYTILPMDITVQINDAVEYYGTDVSALYTVSLNAPLPYDDTVADLSLHLFPLFPVKNVGTYKITGTSSSNDYSVHFLQGTLTVKPLPITVQIYNGYSFYGKAFSTFTYSIESRLPYQENKEDLDVFILKSEGKNVGEYTLTGQCDNKNYDVTFKNAVYNILPLPLTIDYSICDGIIVKTGEAYTVTLSQPNGVIGTDDIGLSYTFDRLSENGLVEERDTEIDREGAYRVKTSIHNDNYYLVKTEYLFTVSSTDVTVDDTGIIAEYESGYSSYTMNIVSTKTYDVDAYKALAGLLDLQRVCAEYEIKTEGSNDEKVTYSLLIDDETVFYSVATYKNGSLVWLPATQEGNRISFTVPLGSEDSYTKFLLYRDIDYMPFLLVDILLLIVAVLLIAVFCKLHRKNKHRKEVFGFLPLLAFNLPKGTLSVLVVLFFAEILTILIFGIAVLIENHKNKKTRR